jgi:DNA-cytosine methyltransferase
MIYGSLCSGIEAASVAWHPLGWRPAFFSEIDKRCSALLKHRFPGVPNHGDMTKFKDWPNYAIDVLVAGTPCQSFSVAGLRKGMADPRGNLTLTFLAIVERYNPAWVLWENVPGVLSDKTGAMRSFLCGLEELGYIVDFDILDAQWFGLAQRRRRVFVCGQHRDDLLKRMTPSSALTILQCLTEILHSICLVGSKPFATARESLDCASLSNDGLRRRMKLFGLDEASGLWPKWQKHLEEVVTKWSLDQSDSALDGGEYPAENMQDGPLMDLSKEVPFILTEELWRRELDEALQVAKSFITSTSTREITQTETFICSKAVLTIAALIARLKPSQPSFFAAASSNLTALKDCIAYARSASNDLFTYVEWLQSWHDFNGQAQRASEFIGSTRVRNFAKVLSLAESLSGHPPPRRQAGQNVAPTIASRPTGRGGLGTDFDCDGGLIAFGGNNTSGPINVATAVNAHGGPSGRIDFESETFISHALRGEGFDASEDGTGRGPPLATTCYRTTGNDGIYETGGVTGALNTATDPNQHIVAYDMRGRDGGAQFEGPHDTVNMRAASGGSSRSYIAFSSKDHGGGQVAAAYAIQERAVSENPDNGPDGIGIRDDGAAYTIEERATTQSVAYRRGVRRITPLEAERLQGFPDGFTQIGNVPDGPRYKQLGNSMAVNVMSWIGRRIQMVQDA